MNAATKLPGDVGPIHFVGIGGIGMSGIAEVLLNHGYVVQGSDLKRSPITDRLAELGAHIFVGQQAPNVEEAEVVVISSAIKPGNAVLDAARARGSPALCNSDDFSAPVFFAADNLDIPFAFKLSENSRHRRFAHLEGFGQPCRRPAFAKSDKVIEDAKF